jgi:Holliday junction resolvase RusA-like endonuclease
MALRFANFDPPFACPPDIVLNLPVPPSINRTRRIDWKHQKRLREWKKLADGFVMLDKRRGLNPPQSEPIERFELRIEINEAITNVDLDNTIKHLIDYLRRIEVIANDAPKNMRKITVEWGSPIRGVRVTIVRLA